MSWQMVAVDLYFICYLVFAKGATNSQFYVGKWLLAMCGLFIAFSWHMGAINVQFSTAMYQRVGAINLRFIRSPVREMVAMNLQLSAATY